MLGYIKIYIIFLLLGVDLGLSKNYMIGELRLMGLKYEKVILF